MDCNRGALCRESARDTVAPATRTCSSRCSPAWATTRRLTHAVRLLEVEGPQGRRRRVPPAVDGDLPQSPAADRRGRGGGGAPGGALRPPGRLLSRELLPRGR